MQLLTPVLGPGWAELVAAEHAEVNDPDTGNVRHAERLHAPPATGDMASLEYQLAIHRELRALHQTIPAYEKCAPGSHVRGFGGGGTTGGVMVYCNSISRSLSNPMCVCPVWAFDL